MPSSTDAVSVALRHSLSSLHRKGASGDLDGESDRHVDSALIGANKFTEVTRHVVDYELADNQQAKTQEVLKTKYIHISTKSAGSAQNGNSSNTSNGFSSNGIGNGVRLGNGVTNGTGKCLSNGSLNGAGNEAHQNGALSNISNGATDGSFTATKNISNGVTNGVKSLGQNGCNGSSMSLSAKANGCLKAPPNCDSLLPQPKHVLYPADKVVLGWRSNSKPGAGMVNLGNTCYLNSTLQALFHVPALVEWLLNDVDHMKKCEQENGPGFGDCITCSMAKTLKLSQLSSVIKPQLISSKLKMICRHMGHGSQEDAHEFMRYLLENMEKAYLKRFSYQKLDTYSKETTPINQIFGGYIRTEVKCLRCHHISTTFQHFQDLILDIRKASKVDDAMDQYFSKEKLDGGESSYKCENCKNLVQASKKFSIERPPKVLCIQLKRFSVTGLKMPKPVEHRQQLDLRRHINSRSQYAKLESLPYRLISMVTHIGPSASCGHYTAIAQCSSRTFHQFDDAHVRPVSFQTVLNTCAYILIYEMEPQNLKPLRKPATMTSLSAISALGNGNSNISNGVIRSLSTAPSVLPAAKDRDRIQFGLSPSRQPTSQPRLVIHSKKSDVSSLASRSPNLHNGSSNGENRPANLSSSLAGSIKQSSCLNMPSLVDKPSLSGITRLPGHVPSLLNGNAKKVFAGCTTQPVEMEKKLCGPLVPYDCDDSSRESSLSPPLDDKSEVLTATATTPRDWQVTNSSGVRSPSIHSESSNHSVASATGSTWNVTEKQSSSAVSYSVSKDKRLKDLKIIDKVISNSECASDTELDMRNHEYEKSLPRAKSADRVISHDEDSGSTANFILCGNLRQGKDFSKESDSTDSGSGKSDERQVGKIKLREKLRKKSHKKAKIRQEERERLNICSSEVQNESMPGKNRQRSPALTDEESSRISVSSNKQHKHRFDAPSSSTWSGDRNPDVLADLQKMSHQGIGADNVVSWNGDRSQLERRVDEDRQERKRSYDDYEDELDRGRVKKMKKHHESPCSQINFFQKHQNYRNHASNNSSWNYGRSDYRNWNAGYGQKRSNNYNRHWYSNARIQRNASHYSGSRK